MESVKQQRIAQSFALNLSTKILLSVSFFSIAIPVFLHYSKSQFFTCTVQIFSSNNDKNYMFLLCNGILVLIVKSAGLMGAETNRKDRSELRESKGSADVNALVAEAEVSVQEVQQAEKKSLIMVKETEFSGSMVIDEEFRQERKEIAVIDEDGVDGLESLTTEELNRKCDEFIRKMKEGIKFEAEALIML